MKFTLRWLREHLDTNADTKTIAGTLTRLGLEVENLHDPAAALRSFTVAQVLSAEPHPNADKLRVCTVDVGGEVLQVVCGAPNARAGMKGVFARTGSTIPGTGLHLKPAKIRGVESNGMLCSMREMGLSDEHEGIIDLPADAPIGKPFAEVLGLDDPVFEIKLTPNRQDCLGVRGIARDLAAAGLGTLKPLDAKAVPGGFKSPIGVRLDFTPQTASACPLFVGRHIRNVKNAPSPRWLQDRLRAIGLRPISTLVDITNLVTFDLDRPLHVFDADKVRGGIQARLARPGEKLHALDGKDYALDGEICVIADESGPLGLGGVMGGEASGVSETTRNVFIEAALFDPMRTAATGRRLGIQSDARYRFERGVDPAFVRPGMEVATRLVLELCGGEPSEVVVAGAEPDWRRSIQLRPSRVRDLGGLDLAEREQVRILEALGFAVKSDDDVLRVQVPSWRSDIHGEADLVEEVTRVYGYDAIPAVPLPRRPVVAKPAIDVGQRRVRAARRALAGRGLYEAVTPSFVSRAHAELFGGGADALVLSNPMSSDLDTMRPCILPSLIVAVGRNVAHGMNDVALFEVGPQYAGDRPGDQAAVAAGIRRGQSGPRHWSARPRDVDAFDAKGDAIGLLMALGFAVESAQLSDASPPWYHPGRSGVLRLGPKTLLAAFGELHPRVLAAMDVKGPLVGFEVYLDAMPIPKAKGTRARPPLAVSDLPSVERDFAFLVERQVSAEQITRAAKSADKELITEVRVFDVYEGAGVPEGRKSVAFSIRLEPKDRTLTEAEIDAVADKVVAAVVKASGGALRS
ncbi:MAG TPA: phenylalanine--tRNA ligase subunit beta [Candidatus Cybelea sp.]|nr:phenylalanine--tRNA ligase subunit beta [Candidatus Cybelea sp.]